MLEKINNKIGYLIKTIAIIGYDSFGPVFIPCKNEKEAKRIEKEEEYEDSYARVHISNCTYLKEINLSEALKKHQERKQKVTPKNIKGILYFWDEEKQLLEFPTINDFKNFANNHLGPGDRLVVFEDGEKVTFKCEYSSDFNEWGICLRVSSI